MGTKLILKICVSDMTFYLVLERKVFYSLSPSRGEGQGGLILVLKKVSAFLEAFHLPETNPDT
jgi:hypothetical protein